MKRGVKIVLAVNLLALAVLSFVYPHLMISPGKLIPAHTQLESDCFACHAPLRGSVSERCTSCHKPETIGRITSTGKPVARVGGPVTFHQKLQQQDCTVCHSDHAGIQRVLRKGRFDHALLAPEIREQCHTCHKVPTDTLHQGIEENCSQCHEQKAWKPASFDHAKYFILDGDHSASCVTCHERNDYKRYTCYGCHEHTPSKIRSEHFEEGIRNFDNCVECHRSAEKDDIKGKENSRSRRREEHDD